MPLGFRFEFFSSARAESYVERFGDVVNLTIVGGDVLCRNVLERSQLVMVAFVGIEIVQVLKVILDDSALLL